MCESRTSFSYEWSSFAVLKIRVGSLGTKC